MKPSDQARWQGSVNSWLAQGFNSASVDSPVNNTILSDTGALVRGWYDFLIIFGSNGDHYHASLEHRNAPNNGSLNYWFMVWKAHLMGKLYINNWFIDSNERLRVKVVNNSDDKLTTTISYVIRA